MKTKHKVSAVVYDKAGKVLARSENSYDKTHPLQAFYAKKAGMPEKQFLHAEVYAIIKALKNGKPYEIHVERRDCKGNLRLSKPCDICMLAIKEAGIKRISYTL